MQYPPSGSQPPPTGNEPSVVQEMYSQQQQPMQQQWPQQQSMYQTLQQPPIYPQQPPMYSQQQPPPMYQQPPMYPQQLGIYPMQQPQIQVNQIVQMQPPVQVVQVNVGKTGPGFLMRVLWFIFIGSWLGFFWLNLGYFFVLTVIGLPLGLIILNRLPWVLTLRPASTPQANVQVAGNITTINIGPGQQRSFLIRTIYFLCVGWWAGYFWACIGYACCLLIVTLPLGLIMLNRLPVVLTLRRN